MATPKKATGQKRPINKLKVKKVDRKSYYPDLSYRHRAHEAEVAATEKEELRQSDKEQSIVARTVSLLLDEIPKLVQECTNGRSPSGLEYNQIAGVVNDHTRALKLLEARITAIENQTLWQKIKGLFTHKIW
jgi:hypothetical protein